MLYAATVNDGCNIYVLSCLSKEITLRQTSASITVLCVHKAFCDVKSHAKAKIENVGSCCDSALISISALLRPPLTCSLTAWECAASC